MRFLFFIIVLTPHLAYSQVFSKSGFINLSASSRNQTSSFENQNLPDSTIKNRLNNLGSIGSDAQIFLKIEDKLQNAVKYGAIAQTELNFNSDKRTENPNLDKIFTFVEGDFGKVEFGNNQAVNQKMKSGPASFARGAGGINGKYLENINLPMAGKSGAASHFILLAQSPIGHGGYAKSFYQPNSGDLSSYHLSQFRAFKDNSFDGVEDATKLSYYLPKIAGVKFGVSYAPNSSNIGITKQVARDVNYTRIENIFSVGANYAEDFDNLGVEFSATAEKGKIRNSGRSDLSAYDFGGSLSYFGFTLGASYGSWGSSLQPTSGDYAKQGKTNYYTFGLSYKIGPIGTSITSLNSSFGKNKYSATSLGFDYKINRNWMPYFEITKFAFDAAAADAINNQGYVFLTGALYSF